MNRIKEIGIGILTTLAMTGCYNYVITSDQNQIELSGKAVMPDGRAQHILGKQNFYLCASICGTLAEEKACARFYGGGHINSYKGCTRLTTDREGSFQINSSFGVSRRDGKGRDKPVEFIVNAADLKLYYGNPEEDSIVNGEAELVTELSFKGAENKGNKVLVEATLRTGDLSQFTPKSAPKTSCKQPCAPKRLANANTNVNSNHITVIVKK